MKLFYTPMPGYVHRVEIVARETGFWDKLERIATNPFESPEALVAANPLSKVPTLVRDDGVPMFGGPVIYEYLDSLNTGRKIYPSGDARWDALRLFGLAEGMFDAADLRVVELRRPEGEKSQMWIDRYQRAVERGLDRLEQESKSFGDDFHIGLISIAGALLWFDWLAVHRGNQIPWRPGRGTLAGWLERFTDRPSYRDGVKEGLANA